MRTLTIILLLLIVSGGVMAQTTTFSKSSSLPIVIWDAEYLKGKPVKTDTLYEVFDNRPIRRIYSTYITHVGKQCEILRKDIYNGKEWIFYSLNITETLSRTKP